MDPADSGGLTDHGAARSFRANLLGQVIGRGIRSAIPFVLAWWLPKTQFGLLTALQAIVDPIRSLSGLGMDATALARLGAHDTTAIVRVYPPLRLLVALAMFVVMLVLSLLVWPQSDVGGVSLLFASMMIVAGALSMVVQVIFTGQQRAQQLFWAPSVAAVVGLSYLAACVVLHAGIHWFVLIPVVMEAAVVVYASHAVHLRIFSPAHLRWADIVGLLKPSLWMAYPTVTAAIYARVGYQLLERQHGLGEVADLGLANRLIDPVLFVASTLTNASISYLSFLRQRNNHEALGQYVKNALLKVLRVLVPIMGLIMLISVWIPDLFSSKWRGAFDALFWLAPASVCIFVCQFCTGSLIALNAQRLLAVIETWNLLLFVGLSLLFIPTMKSSGVALATLVMQLGNACLQSGLLYYLINRSLKRLDLDEGIPVDVVMR
jgi:O-antigen/teichoic acid export membrane protein